MLQSTLNHRTLQEPKASADGVRTLFDGGHESRIEVGILPFDTSSDPASITGGSQ